MHTFPFLPAEAWRGAFWSLLTLAAYALAKQLHQRWSRSFLMPLATAPLLVGAAVLALHGSYTEYSQATHWLVLLLGPTTVAFAIPIYEQRALIRTHWPVLLVGMVAGSLTALLTSRLLAEIFGFDGPLTLSLLPRSISTPFAMSVSAGLGGMPELTAVFCVITGIAGAFIGELILHRVPLASALAKGALLGMGAHGAGTARAHQLGPTEGAVAGLTLVLAGLLNVLAVPLLVALR